MARSLDADLVVDRLAEAVQEVLSEALAPVRAFSTDFGVDRLAPKRVVQVEKVTAAGSANTDPTNYEDDTSTTNTDVAVTPYEYSRTFTITNPEAQAGHRLMTKAKINAQALAQGVWDTVTVLCDPATFTNTKVTVAEASFAAAHRAALWGSLKNAMARHLILSGTAYATHLPTDKNSFQLSEQGAFGWAGIHHATDFSANTAMGNNYGFACAPNAFACAAGLPVRPPGFEEDMVAAEVVTLEGLGLSVEQTVWFSRATRALWAGYSIMWGVAVGDATALTLVESAAT